MAVITRNEVKLLLNIRDHERDNIIDLLIPITEMYIKNYCGNEFLDYDGVEVFPIDLKLPASKIINSYMNNNGNIQKEQIGDVSITYNNVIDNDIRQTLNRYRKFVFPVIEDYITEEE